MTTRCRVLLPLAKSSFKNLFGAMRWRGRRARLHCGGFLQDLRARRDARTKKAYQSVRSLTAYPWQLEQG